MTSITRNILDFYKFNEKNDKEKHYLIKYFTNTNNLGYFDPHSKDTFFKEWNGKDSFIGTVDEHNTYNINAYGLRGEIDENSEVVASGCSITFGVGVPELGRWTNLLSRNINKSIMNLGSPGESIESICTNIISYCVNNKMPKEIFCLFPDFFRSKVVLDSEFYKSKKDKNYPDWDHLELTYCNPMVGLYKDSLFMEIKDQKYIEDSRSPHQLILDSINFIYILESFCLTNNIKLYWSTWDINSNLVMEQLLNIEDFKLKNFTSFFPPNSDKPCNTFIQDSCSLDHNSEFKDHLCWGRGSDYSIINSKKTSEYAHPGIHFQHHVADLFYNLTYSAPTDIINI